MSFIHRHRFLLSIPTALGVLALTAVCAQAQGRGGGGGGRGGGGSRGGGGGAHAGGGGAHGARPGGAGGGGGPRYGRPGYGYGHGAYGYRGSAVVIGGYGYQPYWGFYGGFGWGYPYYGYGAYYGGYYPSYPAYPYYRTYPYYGAPDGAGYATPDQRSELSVNPRTQPPDNGSSEYGALSIRVQPVDAEILIDDEPWATPTGADRVIIEVGEGRHHIEVRKEGFAQYTEDVLVRRNAVFTLNVSLLRGADERK